MPTAASSDALARPAERHDEILVTGSRIRGVAPVGSDVIALDRADIESTAAVSTAEIFRIVPQILNAGANETVVGPQGGGGNLTYANAINLRGIGPSATLTLVNGRRVVPIGLVSTFKDPSVIPLLALARVEIVADGASAIYGSDAIAGVVNLIARRDLDGVEANARYGLADDYQTRQAGIAAGKIWDSGQIMVAFEQSGHSRLNGRDRRYTVGDQRYRGRLDFRSTNCNPGNIVVGGVTYPIPAGGVTPATAGLLVPGLPNRCDLGRQVDLIPRIRKTGLVLTARQELLPGVTLSADGFWYKRTFSQNRPPIAQTITVPNSNAFFVAPPGTNTAAEVIGYNFAELGAAETHGQDKAWQASLELDIDLPSGWSLGIAGSYGDGEAFSTNSFVINPAALAAALRSGNPATAFDPYGLGRTSPAVRAGIANARLILPGSGRMKLGQVKLDGPVITLPGGPVRAAIGAEILYQDFYQAIFTAVPLGGPLGAPSRFGTNDRTVASAFAEVVVPIVGARNAVPGIRSLEFTAAGRFDRYGRTNPGGTVIPPTGVGYRTFNPKFGLNWTPFTGLKLRGTWGTSFKAPELYLVTPNNRFLNPTTLADPLSPTGVSTGYILVDVNTDLAPETATTWTIGADISPARNAKLSLTYFNLLNRNQPITVLGDPTILQREALYPGVVTRNPSAASVAALFADGYTIGNGSAPLASVPWIVDVRSRNSGIIRIDGIDLAAEYRLETQSAGSFGVGLVGTWFRNYKVAQTPAAPLISRYDRLNYPTRYKLRGAIDWQYRGLRTNLFVNHVPAYRNDAVTPVETIGSFTTVDLNLAFDVPAGGSASFLKKMGFSLNVSNLFDRDPPLATIAPGIGASGGFDAQQASPLGRLVTLAVRTRL